MKRIGSLNRGAALAAGVLLLTACASPAPPPVPPPLREGVRPVGLDQTGLACLDHAPEVVAAHHERAPIFAASRCDTRSLDYVAGAFGALGAIAALGVAASCAGPEDGVYVDMASLVRDRFVEGLSPGPLASKVASPAACPASDSLDALRRSFGDEPVIDFKTVDWQRVTAGNTPVFVPATVRGRLVDPKDGRVLWEEGCTIAPDRAAADLDDVRGTLEHSAALCAERFTERFSEVRPAG